MLLGSEDDCAQKCAQFVKSQALGGLGEQGKSKASRLTKENLVKANVELEGKLTTLQQQFQKIKKEKEELEELLQVRDEEIGNLKERLEAAEAAQNEAATNNINSNNNSNNSNNNNDNISQGIQEIKSMVASLLGQRMATSEEDRMSQMIAGNNMVPLSPESSVLVSNRRFIKARSSKTGTSFMQRAFTAVFTFDEIIGASLTGRKRKLQQVEDD